MSSFILKCQTNEIYVARRRSTLSLLCNRSLLAENLANVENAVEVKEEEKKSEIGQFRSTIPIMITRRNSTKHTQRLCENSPFTLETSINLQHARFSSFFEHRRGREVKQFSTLLFFFYFCCILPAGARNERPDAHVCRLHHRSPRDVLVNWLNSAAGLAASCVCCCCC